MRQIYGYVNMGKVVGIPSTSSAQYYNNRYYRRQQEREQARDKKREQKNNFTLIKPQVSQDTKVYQSNDPKIIYFQEYCKVRNTKIYGQLNPKVNTNIIDYSTRYPQYASSRSTNVNRMLEAYNQMNKNKNVIIDFEARKAKSSSNKPVKKQEVKPIVTKKEEMNRFKNSIKEQANIQDDKKAQLDRAVIEFEKALRQRKAYEEQTKNFRYNKGRRNPGFER